MKRAALLLAFSIAPAGLVAADPPVPWHLDYDAETPRRLATKDGPLWIVAFTLKNSGPEAVPLAVGHELRRAGEAALREDFLPDDLLAVFAEAQGLTRAGRIGLEENLAKEQQRGRWLSTTALTQKRELAAGESVQAVAVFREDGRTGRDLAVIAQGLDDPVRLFETWRGESGLFTVSTRRRTVYERQGSALVPLRRDEYVTVPELPVARADVSVLTRWLDHDDPLVRDVALDLLIRYVDPSVPAPAAESGGRTLSDLARAQRALAEWLARQPEIKALQNAAPSELRKWADAIEKRSPGLKRVAEALRDPGNGMGLQVAESLIDGLGSMDGHGDEVLRLIREIATSAEFRFDTSSLDPKAPPKALRGWQEWRSRFGSTARWNPNLRIWEAAVR